MTICIGAICDKESRDGEKVVAATDRMVTGWIPPAEYEPEEPKVTTLTNNSIVLTAGDATAHTELINYAIPTIRKEKSPSITKIVEVLSESYNVQRKRKVEEKILRPRGFDLKSFYANISMLPPQLYVPIDSRIMNYDYNLQMLVVGVDSWGGHLFDVSDPGVTRCLDSLGHHEIGSGIVQARTTFISQKYTTRTLLNEAIYLVYEAKRDAEIAPGVGREVDIAVIEENSITSLEENIIKKLEKIYDQRKSGEAYADIKAKVKSLFEKEGEKDAN